MQIYKIYLITILYFLFFCNYDVRMPMIILLARYDYRFYLNGILSGYLCHKITCWNYAYNTNGIPVKHLCRIGTV
ncbi:hypothetical protein D3C81_966740 [compost metagenome]